MCQGPDGKQKLRTFRGLGTRDETEANRRRPTQRDSGRSIVVEPVGQSKAASKYEKQIVAAFYDYVEPENRDGWFERERILPLPGAERGYAKAQFVVDHSCGKDDNLAS